MCPVASLLSLSIRISAESLRESFNAKVEIPCPFCLIHRPRRSGSEEIYSRRPCRPILGSRGQQNYGKPKLLTRTANSKASAAQGTGQASVRRNGIPGCQFAFVRPFVGLFVSHCVRRCVQLVSVWLLICSGVSVSACWRTFVSLGLQIPSREETSE